MRAAQRLLDQLGTRGSELPLDQLGPALAALLVRARVQLVHAPVSDSAFVDRLAQCLLAGDTVDLATLERLRSDELYLACALAAGDDRAMAIAERDLVPDMRKAIGKIDPTPAFVDEITQRVRDKLFVGAEPAITGYRGTGPLARWVSVVASRLALDEKRKRSDDHGSDLEHIPAPDDPELELVWRDCADRYKAALATAFAELDKRDRNLIRQRYIDELNIEAIARLYRVDQSTAYRWLKAIEEKLADRTRETLMKQLAISTSQVASMERMVASQLAISLAGMLRARR